MKHVLVAVKMLCEGRIVIVTGAGRGLGRAHALELAREGARVVVNDLGTSLAGGGSSSAPAEAVAAEIRDAGGQAVANADDVASWEGARRLIHTAIETWGGLDALVNNAGGSPPVEAARASPRFSTAIIALNLVAPLVFATRAQAAMADGGVILNIASTSGTRPSPGTAAYGAAKAGLLNLTRSLAAEWAPRIRVNAVTPGPLDTDGATALHGGREG